MKAIINRRTIIIFSTALLLAVVAIVSVNVFNSSGPVTGLANAITSPVRAMMSAIAGEFSKIFAATYEYDQLVARNEELSERVKELEENTREAQRLREENRELRAMLDFSENYGDYFSELASITARGGDNWSSSFVIDKGYTNSSVAKGMPVITEYGALVGQVYDVGPTSSTIITVLDTKFSAAAYIGLSDTREEASTNSVARGDFSYMNSGMLVFDQIDDDLVVRKIDMVITSGWGGVYPPGLMIGEIEDVFRNANGIGRFATITPLANLNNLTDVWIITEFVVTED